MILNPGLHWPRAGVSHPQPCVPMSCVFVHLPFLTCVLGGDPALFWWTCAGSFCPPLLGEGLLPSGPVARGSRARVGPRQAWMGARNFLSCFFSTMDLKWTTPRRAHPESREESVTRNPRHPTTTVSLMPCHLQVEVKFQNKQRALFLEEMCYTQK